MNNRKEKFGICYHVFADNKDFYEDTLKKALIKYRQLRNDGELNIRLYQCWYNSKEEAQSLNDCCDNEDCLRSIGGFPI